MKILHILYQSLPQISGSSVRTRDILMTQKEIGMDVIAITSPFQSAKGGFEVLNNIKYYRTSVGSDDSISDKTKPFFERVFRIFKIFSFYKKIKELIVKETPDVLHAHAMFFCGLPALFLSRKFQIPVVYEFRSLWMIKKERVNETIFTKLIENVLIKLEVYVMKRVSSVVVINEGLKEFAIKEGVKEENIVTIKNAVNTTLISQLKAKLEPEVSNKIRFGYIGTLTPHEGLDLLIVSFNNFNKKYPDTELVIYGGGIEEEKIRELAKINKNISYLGSVNPININIAFNKIDIIVNPRYKNKLTDSVTPLKPLEAMAYEKIVIGSDVGGIVELIKENFNGFLFSAGCEVDLERVLEMVYLLDVVEVNKIKKIAFNYVVNNKSWLKNAALYENLYKNLIIHNE